VRKGKKALIKRHYIVNYNRMGRLLEIAIEQRNKRQPKKPKLKERSYRIMKKFVVEYMKAVVKEVSEQPVCHPFYTVGVSHVQVLQKDSMKGYAWDVLYNMRDFEIVMHHIYPYAKVIFDTKMMDGILEKARSGEHYMTEISEHNRILINTVNELK